MSNEVCRMSTKQMVIDLSTFDGNLDNIYKYCLVVISVIHQLTEYEIIPADQRRDGPEYAEKYAPAYD